MRGLNEYTVVPTAVEIDSELPLFVTPEERAAIHSAIDGLCWNDFFRESALAKMGWVIRVRAALRGVE
ncbi:MAG: hypothetical protein ACYDGM_14635 [Vulcanimicrobiaceae bacterium]